MLSTTGTSREIGDKGFQVIDLSLGYQSERIM